MPMVWDEEVGAMVWEDDTATPAQATPPPQQTVYDRFKAITDADPTGKGVRQEPAGTLTQVGKSSILPAIGTIAGGALGGAGGAAMGGVLGEAGNQAFGITPRSNLAMMLSALPGPGAAGVKAVTKGVDSLKRTAAGMNPALGAGLAEEAFNRPKGALQGMDPGKAAVDAAYAKVRNDPQYTAMGTPTTTQVPLQYPGGGQAHTPGGTPITITQQVPNYPVKLPTALSVSSEQAKQLAAAQRMAPGLADAYTAKVTKLASEGGTIEDVHRLLVELNEDIRNPGTATGSEVKTLKDYKTAIWNDLNNQPLAADLRDANAKFARHMAVQELDDALMSSRGTQGELTVVPNIGTVIKKMEDVYNDRDNPFIRSAITPQEFYGMIDDFRKLGVEQLQTRSNAGSLAAYGAVAGGGGGAGAAIAEGVGAPAGAGGLVGSAVGLGWLRQLQERRTKAAFEKGGAPVRAKALQRFRTPPQAANIDIGKAGAVGQIPVQTISEMFLRRRGIDPATLGQAEEEEQQGY